MNLLLLSDLYSLKLSNADYWPLLGNKGKGTKKLFQETVLVQRAFHSYIYGYSRSFRLWMSRMFTLCVHCKMSISRM